MWCDPFFETAEAVVDLLGADEVRERWEEPSALDRMTVGQLAGHTARAVLTVERYLDRPAEGDPVDAVAYLLTVSDDTDLQSPINKQVRERAQSESEAGVEALLEATMRALTTLRLRLPVLDPSQLVTVLGGIPIRLDEYLKTRLVEMIVHIDDVCASVELPLPDVGDESLEIVSTLLSTVADVRHGAWTVIRAFTRRERMLSWPGVF